MFGQRKNSENIDDDSRALTRNTGRRPETWQWFRGGEGIESVLDCSGLMPQFVIEREVPGAGSLSEAELRELSLRSLGVLTEMGPQIQWLHSYVTEDKVYCVYLAPDENAIREHARRVGIPADRVSAVRRLIDPVNLQ